MVECSLWLKPAGKAYSSLSHLIASLAHRYSTPIFPPHVTLLDRLVGSEEDLQSRTSALAAVVPPLRIDLENMEYSDEYFRSLFVRVKKTAELTQANRRAREIFGKSNAEYMPHLSLMYGNLPSSSKEEILSNLRRDFTWTSFDVTIVQLVRTEGRRPEHWHLIQEFALMSSDRL